jgi:hypothetical protein
MCDIASHICKKQVLYHYIDINMFLLRRLIMADIIIRVPTHIYSIRQYLFKEIQTPPLGIYRRYYYIMTCCDGGKEN